MLLASAVASMENGGSQEAEAYLAVVGEPAVPVLKDLLAATEDPRVKERLRSLLLYAGEDTGLSVEDQVGVLLRDLSREESHPYVGIKALDRILELGDEAIPPLETAAEQGDARGRAARRLLSLLREEQ